MLRTECLIRLCAWLFKPNACNYRAQVSRKADRGADAEMDDPTKPEAAVHVNKNRPYTLAIYVWYCVIGFDLFLSAENQRGKGMLGISEVCCCLYHLVSQKQFVMDAVDKWTSGQVDKWRVTCLCRRSQKMISHLLRSLQHWLALA